MRAHITIILIAGATAFLADTTSAQSRREQGERILRDQEKAWNISCKAVHARAHELVNRYVAPLANRASAAAPLDRQLVDASKELKELADQTLKCYGLEPIALHSGFAFESDFGELHEALRHAEKYIASFTSGEPEVAKGFWLGELQKRMHELRMGTGRRYPARV